MNIEKYPSLNKKYAAFIILIGASSGCLFFYYAFSKLIDAPTSAILLSFASLAIGGSIFSVYSASRILVTGDDIKLNKTVIKWSNITKIETIGYGIHIHEGSKRIIIAPWAYQEPESLIAFIRDRTREQPNK